MTKKDLQRTEFIKMTGGLAFLALSNKWSFAESILSFDLVASAQKRYECTISLLKQLVTDIGPRPSGSKAYAKAAKIVLKEMRRSLPQVNYDRYEFEEWPGKQFRLDCWSTAYWGDTSEERFWHSCRRIKGNSASLIR